ncbi:uncharacterized protein [Asterias amurensis]|uniref:uncharacterized protein n=1 Tax=Asterias amurensis TaxID=7602 RepID=UPI003AB62A5B
MTSALADHVYIPARLKSRWNKDSYKWSVEETKLFLELRRENIAKFHSGNRGSIQKAFGEILDEMGLTGKVTPNQARKKWNNLAQLYRKIVKRHQHAELGSNKFVFQANSWPFFKDVQMNLLLEPDFEGATLCDVTTAEDLGQQIAAQFLKTAFVPLDPVEDDDEREPKDPPSTTAEQEQPQALVKKSSPEKPVREKKSRQKHQQEMLLETIKELSRLQKKQEEILHAQNQLTISLLTQLV